MEAILEKVDDRLAMRRVLVLAYFFPPLGGAGVQRTLKFVRYLAPLGWKATVITTSSRAYEAKDPSLEADVPSGTRIVRAPAPPLLRKPGFAAERLRMPWLMSWLMWPDGAKGWAPFALVAALREVRRERPDVIFSSSAPYGGHLVAMCVARLTGIPWVADFRDEWTWNSGLAAQPKRLARFTMRCERAITATAVRVTLAADYFRIEGLDKDDPRRKVILNGVDPDDLPRGRLEPARQRFVLAFVGTIYEAVDPTPVLRVLADLIERGKIDPAELEMRFVGNIWLEGFKPPAAVPVRKVGYVEHARAVEEMCSATALLLFVPSSSLAPCGKLFEYLASGRPVLCVTRPENLASRLVREWDAGATASPDDDDEIADAILTLWERWRSDRLSGQEEVRRRVLERYSRQATALELANVLEEAVSTR